MKCVIPNVGIAVICIYKSKNISWEKVHLTHTIDMIKFSNCHHISNLYMENIETLNINSIHITKTLRWIEKCNLKLKN